MTNHAHDIPVLKNVTGKNFPTALLDGTPVHLVGYTSTGWKVRFADGRQEWITGSDRISDQQIDRRVDRSAPRLGFTTLEP